MNNTLPKELEYQQYSMFDNKKNVTHFKDEGENFKGCIIFNKNGRNFKYGMIKSEIRLGTEKVPYAEILSVEDFRTRTAWHFNKETFDKNYKVMTNSLKTNSVSECKDRLLKFLNTI